MTSAYKTLGRYVAQFLTAHSGTSKALRILSRAGILPDIVWKRLPIGKTFTVSLPKGKSFKYKSILTDSIGRALYWRGIYGWETETIGIFFDLAARSNVILDIGANTGAYTLIACAANEKSSVYAFEPVPHIYDLLTTNVTINNWRERCVLENIAISDIDDVVQFHIPHGQVPTSASLNVKGFRGYEGYVTEVKVRRLDEVCRNRKIDLVKIDVEGFEDKVLLGMKEILFKSAPAIIVECNPDGPFRVMEELLSEFDYKFFHIGPKGPRETASIQPDSTQRFRNYLCLPKQGRTYAGSIEIDG